MLRNYLKVALRQLRQNKVLSLVNILGLGIGMAFALIVGVWVRYELSFDTFHEHADRLAMVRKHTLANGKKGTQLPMPLPLYQELKTNYPAIQRISRMDTPAPHGLLVGDKKLNKTGLHVDPDFLQMFTFPLVEGDARTALSHPRSLVLTRSVATALFGAGPAVGKTVRLDNEHDMIVTGVAEDVPGNSTITFEFLAPFDFKVQTSERLRYALDSWGNNVLTLVAQVREGASMEAVSRLIGPIVTQKDPEITNHHLFLQPLLRVHLYNDYKNWVNTGGRIAYIRLFGVIGIFVLLIACINFMNLATARSEKRAREVGVRKAIGSRRRELIAQFLTESMLTACIAFVVSLILVQLILPLLADMGFAHVRFDWGHAGLTGGALAVCLLTGLAAGSYPAFYLSSFTPLKALKGRLQQGGGAVAFRKGLVVFQFVIAIGLVVSTIVVFQQIRHGRGRSLGYEPDNLITMNMSADLQQRYAMVKQALLNTGYVAAVGRSSTPMTSAMNSWNGFTWEGGDPAVTRDVIFDVVMADMDFEKTAGLQFLQGRPFSPDHRTDSTGVILNRAALDILGYKDPIGKTMRLDERTFTIIGVTENVLNRDPFRSFMPALTLFWPSRANTLLVRLKEQADPGQALAAIQSVSERYNPAYPFAYRFVDQEFETKFSAENQAGRLAALFAGLSVLICCLGLFGLAAFMAERRTKEIGIRKVLGASVAGLWILLSKEFMLLVAMACAIASPLALWAMQQWLEQYEYRVTVGWWAFGAAGALALLIALTTVSIQTVRAALVNPVRSLRAE